MRMRSGALIVALLLAGCGGSGGSRQEKADRQICAAGKSMIDNPGSSPFVGLDNIYATPAIRQAAQQVIQNTEPGAADPTAEPLRGALADLRRVCGGKWRS